MTVKHVPVADIPLIIEFCKNIDLFNILDKHLPTHGNRKGLSNPHLIIVWLAYMLTENNHCKSPVQEWVGIHKLVLEAILGKEISNTDFDDCQLARLLEDFADDNKWHGIEESFYKDGFSILNLDTSAPSNFKENSSNENEITGVIKLDSTTTYGHHEIIKDGIMQRGFSKDHRPDLPQLKIMVSVEGNTGMQIAADVVSGNLNDDSLYLPILERTRKITDTKNCLICGDCKMSSLGIRGNININSEYYLTPLQLCTESMKKTFNSLVEAAINGEQCLESIVDTNEKGEKKLIGEGYEISRQQFYQGSDHKITEWTERIILVKSFDHADQEKGILNKKIKKLKENLCETKSNLYDTEEEAKADLIAKIKKLEEIKHMDCLTYETEVACEIKIKKRAEKRNDKVREGTYNVKKFRAVVINVEENNSMIDKMVQKMGWRIYATNADKLILKFSEAYIYYRKTMYVIEVGFHVVKDHLEISPLYVWREDQLLGLTRLLMLALKILTIMTATVRANMKKENVILKGLYAGQKARKHPKPTAQSLLEYFARQNIALVGCKVGEEWFWTVSPLNNQCLSIIKLLGLREGCYIGLADAIELEAF